jgi:hypothetical protein
VEKGGVAEKVLTKKIFQKVKSFFITPTPKNTTIILLLFIIILLLLILVEEEESSQ